MAKKDGGKKKKGDKEGSQPKPKEQPAKRKTISDAELELSDVELDNVAGGTGTLKFPPEFTRHKKDGGAEEQH